MCKMIDGVACGKKASVAQGAATLKTTLVQLYAAMNKELAKIQAAGVDRAWLGASAVLGSASALTGAASVGFAVSGVGSPVGLALGVVSNITGALATTIDCAVNGISPSCVLGVLGSTLGVGGFAVRKIGAFFETPVEQIASGALPIDIFGRNAAIAGGIWGVGGFFS